MSRGLGDVYKRQVIASFPNSNKADAIKSKERIVRLTEGRNLYPGHGDAYIHYNGCIEQGGNGWRDTSICSDSNLSSHRIHPSFYARKSCYIKSGGFNTDFQIAGDYEFFLRFFLKERIYYQYIDLDVVVMRFGGISNRSFSSVLIELNLWRHAELTVYIRTGLCFFPAFLWKWEELSGGW